METRGPGPAGEAVDTPRHRALASASRVAILRLVRSAPDGLTTGAVATATGLHLSTTRAHLDRLVTAGLLVRERGPAGTPGRPAWRYRPAAADPAPAPYRALAAALLQHVADTAPARTPQGGTAPADDGPGATRADPAPAGTDPAVWRAAARAGEDWGRRMAATLPAAPPGGYATGAAPTAAVVRALDALGFSPRAAGPPADGELDLRLHTCPFLDLVADHADAICGLHQGLTRGVFAAAGGAGGHVELLPFGAADACVLRLRTQPGDGTDR